MNGVSTNETGRSLTRRTFLKTSGAAATALALPGTALARHRRRWRRPPHVKSHLRRSSYHQLVGQPFTVRGSHAQLRLASIEDLNPAQAGSDNAFALVFTAPPGAPGLINQAPELYHRSLGQFQFLFTSGTTSASRPSYVAVINRLHA